MVLTSEQTSSVEMVESEMTVLLDGDEQESGSPDFEVSIEQSERLVFRDVVLATDGDRVTSLSRTYRELSQTQSQTIETPEGGDTQDSDQESALEETTVVFTWDADEDAYTAAFAEDEDGDEDLLADLEFDAHLACFLPEGPVSEGDSWEPAIAAFNLLQSPGGDLHFRAEDEEDDDNEIRDEMEENVEGTITCTFTGVREEGGARLAVIAVTIEASTSGDEEQNIEAPFGSGTASREIELTFDLTGELLWDLGAARLASFELEGDMVYTMTLVQEVSGEMEVEATQVQKFEGTTQLSLTVE
jgi:hypothetical protein